MTSAAAPRGRPHRRARRGRGARRRRRGHGVVVRPIDRPGRAGVAEWMADEFGDDDEPEDRGLVPIESHGSRAAYGDMVTFASAVSDRRGRDLLQRALEGRGAFRRFRARCTSSRTSSVRGAPSAGPVRAASDRLAGERGARRPRRRRGGHDDQDARRRASSNPSDTRMACVSTWPSSPDGGPTSRRPSDAVTR